MEGQIVHEGLDHLARERSLQAITVLLNFVLVLHNVPKVVSARVVIDFTKVPIEVCLKDEIPHREEEAVEQVYVFLVDENLPAVRVSNGEENVLKQAKVEHLNLLLHQEKVVFNQMLIEKQEPRSDQAAPLAFVIVDGKHHVDLESDSHQRVGVRDVVNCIEKGNHLEVNWILKSIKPIY